jgi:hypothetical protein
MFEAVCRVPYRFGEEPDESLLDRGLWVKWPSLTVRGPVLLNLPTMEEYEAEMKAASERLAAEDQSRE